MTLPAFVKEFGPRPEGMLVQVERVDRKTANALGFKVPQSLLLRADKRSSNHANVCSRERAMAAVRARSNGLLPRTAIL